MSSETRTSAQFRRGLVCAIWLAMSLTAGNAMAGADTSTAGGDETAFRALYKELVEIDTTRSAGSCTRAAEAMRGQGARVIVAEVDPICALQAVMDGYQVTTIESVLDEVDIFVTGTGNENVITVDHLMGMKHLAIVANVGHFDNEVDMAALERLEGAERIEIKPQVHEWRLPSGRAVLVLSEGRLMNLGNATGHPSFVMSTSFANQVLAQIELYAHGENYETAVHVLPKHLDEEVARLHLSKVGARLTTLTQEQADYINVPVEGPFKGEQYRY